MEIQKEKMENQKDKVLTAIQLIERMPPSKLQKNFIGILSLVDQETADIIREKVDLPHSISLQLEIGKDPITNQPFIMTEFNRDGDYYRSPISNVYVPQANDCYIPSGYLRELQIKANLLFSEYTRLYYDEGGICSFYVCETQTGFSCGYFARKCTSMLQELQEKKSGLKGGTWDSFNIINVKIDYQSKKIQYKINSTILIEFSVDDKDKGNIDLCGFLRKNKEQNHKFKEEKELEDIHLENIGRLVEDIEINLRQQIQMLYVGKTKDIIFNMRFPQTRQNQQQKKKLASQIIKMKNK